MKNEMQNSFDFMLNEYNAVIEFRKLMIEQTEGRVILYFKMLAVALTVILSYMALGDGNALNQSSIVACFILMLLYIFGMTQFSHVIEGHISIINYTKKLNIVRSFFYEHLDGIDKYKVLPTNDKKPEFGGYGFGDEKILEMGGTKMYLVFNSVNLFSAGGILSHHMYYDPYYQMYCESLWLVMFLVFIALAIGNYCCLAEKADIRLNEASRKYLREKR